MASSIADSIRQVPVDLPIDGRATTSRSHDTLRLEEPSRNGFSGQEITPVIDSTKEDVNGQTDGSGRLHELELEAATKIRSKLRLSAVLAGLSLTLLISALNSTIVSTAIPTIVAELHSASGYSWIGGAYLLASGASAPIWSKLSDIWGRKPILLTAVAMYFTMSIICALSNSMRMLIVGRALQGTAGGGLAQLVTITISDLFSMRTRPLYLGLLDIMWAIAGGIGPVLGGVFAQYVSWRWIFYVSLPVSGTAFILLLLFLDVHNPKTKLVEGAKAIDWFGSLFILGLMVMLLLGLNFGGMTFPWNSPMVICLIVFGLFMSVLFFFNETRFARYPIMPLRILSHKSNAACLLVAFTQHFAVLSTEYYLPLYFQSVRGAAPVISGVLLIPLIFATAIMAILCGLYTNRTGRYIELIWIGVVLMTIGNGLYIHLNATSSLAEVIAFEVVAGLGVGLLFQPPLIALQALVPQDDSAAAVGTLSFVQTLATSLAVVLGGIVFQDSMDLQVPKLHAAGLPSNITDVLSGTSAAANTMLVKTIANPGQRLLVKQAFSWSIRNIFILSTGVSACGILASSFIVKAVLSNEHVETRTGIQEKKKSDVIIEG